MATGVRQDTRLSAALLSAGRAPDAAAIALVPLVLVAAYALPEATRAPLVLDYESPTLLGMYASHFVHFSVPHLATNVAAYLLAVPSAYCYCALAGRRTDFFVTFAVVLVAFPFALSGLNVALVRPRVGFGFSGLAMAFIGFLPVALALYVRERVAPAVTLDHAPLLFFAGAAVVAALALPATTPGVLAGTPAPGNQDVTRLAGLAFVAACVAVALYGASLWRALGPTGFRRAASRVGYAEFAAVGVLLVVLFPLVAFPQDVSVGGAVLNVYTHLLGYCLGFIAPFATLRAASTAG